MTVVDVREAFLTPTAFRSATLVRAHFSQFADAREARAPAAFVLVMNHHVERDQESLRFASNRMPPTSACSDRARATRSCSPAWRRRATCPTPSKTSRVRSPVGLSLGAETPDEVAVSILGEILAIRRGFEGGFLSGSVRSLHRPEDRRLLASS